MSDTPPDRVEAAQRRLFAQIEQTIFPPNPESLNEQPPIASTAQDFSDEKGPLLDAKKSTVLYLAYGSNMCDETFLGKRNIRPLSAINVLVPDLRLTFDLPGVPYSEPCFANSARRTSEEQEADSLFLKQKSLRVPDERYHKRRWHKGLVGVAYEVTRVDFAQIIATEGGGSAYKDVLVDCYPLAADQTLPVPNQPSGPTIRAHTLFASDESDSDASNRVGGRFHRPDPDYAQPSARYLKLITDGARERGLPFEYQQYLGQIRSYTVTTVGQKIARLILMATFFPLVTILFSFARMFADKKGRSPAWLRAISSAIFESVWVEYDYVLRPLLGDGERTVEDRQLEDTSHV